MKNIFLTLVAFLSFGRVQAASVGGEMRTKNKICVLNFEHPGYPVSEIVTQVFANNPSIRIYNPAQPLDLLACVQGHYSEIIIIAHALQFPHSADGKHPVNLTYLLPLNGLDKQNAIEQKLAALRSEEKAIYREILLSGRSDFQSPFEEAKAREISEAIVKYTHYPAQEALYAVEPLLPRAIRLAREELNRQSSQFSTETNGVSLKRIRLMSCIPNQVLNQYSDLRALIAENHIALDVAPQNAILSFLEGQAVTSPDPEWLKRSLFQINSSP